MQYLLETTEQEKQAIQELLSSGTWVPLSVASRLFKLSPATIKVRALEDPTVKTVKFRNAPVLVRIDNLQPGTGMVGRPKKVRRKLMRRRLN